MQVMVHMLINNRRLLRRTLKLLLIDRALVPSRIICGLLPRRAIITVDILLLALLLVVMLLWQDLGVLQRLDGGVVVVLVLLFLDECLFAGLVRFLDVGVLDCGVDFGVDGGVGVNIDIDILGGGFGCGGGGGGRGWLLGIVCCAARAEELAYCCCRVIHFC